MKKIKNKTEKALKKDPKRTTIIIFLSLFTIAVWGQTNNGYNATLPQVIPSSPQAAAFARYGEYPISPATGVPQIDIPLYTVECGDIKIPLSISYHASGIKVEDIATPTGLGWALNFGGVITRQVYGLDDRPGITRMAVRSEEQAKSFMNQSAYNDRWRIWAAYSSLDDTQYDRYLYNLEGQTGIFRKSSVNDQIVTIPYSPLKIEETAGGFKITNTNGLIYYFEKTDWSGPSHAGYTSAWYVTKIESQMTGKSVIYKYIQGNGYTQYLTGQVLGSGTGWEVRYDDYYGKELRATAVASDLTNNRTILWTVPALLDEIIWDNNKIKLNYSSDRKDKYKDRLNNIVISSGSNVIKNITFNNNSYWGDSEKNFRMRLNSVEIKGNNNSSVGERYTFRYNSNALPDYNSFFSSVLDVKCKEDYWGYYNGRSSNNFIPQEYNTINSNFSANRNPDEYYMQYCVLKEIDYPTGGTSIFEYEANRASSAYDYNQNTAIVGGLRIKSIISKTNTGQEIKKSYEYAGYAIQMIKADMFQYYQKRIYSAFSAIHYDYFETRSETWRINTSNPLYSITGRSSSPVFYHTVTEYSGSINNNSGKKVCKYLDNFEVRSGMEWNVPDNVDGSDVPRFWTAYNNYDFGLLKPLSISEEVFESTNNNYVIRKKIQNFYNEIDLGNTLCGVFIGCRDTWIHEGSNYTYNYLTNIPNYVGISNNYLLPYSSWRDFFQENIIYYNIKAFRIFNLLQSCVTTEYNTNGNISTTITYVYDPQCRTLSPIKTTIIKSNGANYVEQLKHPYDFNSAPYTEMTQNNVIEPVVKKTMQNGNGTMSVQNNYRNNNNIYVLDNVQAGKDNNLETRITYHNYDTYGNPVYLSKDDATKLFYVWGYKGQYPIAEIQMGDYTFAQVEAAVKSVFSVANLDILSQQETPNETALTNGSLQNALSKALVTTYTYKPLVGIRKMQDPRKIVTEYLYDDFGRLKQVLVDGKKESEYQYHYKE